MDRERADKLLVEQGLAETRAKAQAAILAGCVSADGRPVLRPSQPLSRAANLVCAGASPWVSRSAEKLLAGLAAFGVEPALRLCLDIGASSGGFTQALLAKGAARVAACDVGHGQLHALLRADPRVLCLEGRDARSLSAADVGFAPELIVCDASFIGAAKALAQPFALAAAQAEALVLIKPQYEAGPGVRVTPANRCAIAEAAAAGLDGLAGFRLQGLIECPKPGADGMVEYLAHFQAGCGKR